MKLEQLHHRNLNSLIGASTFQNESLPQKQESHTALRELETDRTEIDEG